MYKQFSDDEIKMRDLMRASIHEHAHLALIEKFGSHGSVSLWRNPNGGEEEKCFSGRCHFRRDALDPHALRIVGLAGQLAEDVWTGWLDMHDDEDVEDYFDNFDLDTIHSLSATDGALIGPLELSLFLDTAAALRSVWPVVLRRAELEVEDFLQASTVDACHWE